MDKIKNVLEDLNSRIDQAKEIISELKNRLFENTQRKKKTKRNKEHLTRPMRQHKKANVGVSGFQEGLEKGVESLFKEIISENFLNLEKGVNIQVQEDQNITKKI